MVLGTMLIAVSLLMLVVAFILYLDNKMSWIGYILCLAILAALFGAAVIDEQLALDRSPDSEMHDLGFEGASSFHSYNSRMPEATEAIKDWMAIQWVSTPSTRAKMRQ